MSSKHYNSDSDADYESDQHHDNNSDTDSVSSVDSYDSNIEYERDVISHHGDKCRDNYDHHYDQSQNNYRNRKQMDARKNFLNMSKKQTITAIEVGCNIKNIYWPSHRWLYWKFMSTKRLADSLHEERDRLFYDQSNLPTEATTTTNVATSPVLFSKTTSSNMTSAHDQFDYKIESLSRRIRKLEQIEHSAAAILCEFYRYSSSVVPCYSRCLLQSENGEYAYGHILVDIRSDLQASESSDSEPPTSDSDSDDHSDHHNDRNPETDAATESDH